MGGRLAATKAIVAEDRVAAYTVQLANADAFVSKLKLLVGSKRSITVQKSRNALFVYYSLSIF